MKILIAVESHFQEYGGPYTAITQKIEFLNKKKIINKLIYNKNKNYSYNLDLNFIISNYDVIHIYGIWIPFLIKVYRVAKSLNKKIICSPIGALEPWSLSQKKIKKTIAWHVYQKKMLNNVDIVHATSEIEAKNVVDKGIKTKVEIIGHGLEIDKNFTPELKNKTKKNILFFSRIHNKKGIIELVSAWKKLKNKLNWQLDIYGPITDKNYFNEIIKKIDQLGLKENIIVRKSEFDIKKKKDIFKNSDGFILPSKSENFGISIGESLSFGLPVLTTFETPWKIINDYKAGYVFNFSEPDIQTNLDKFMGLSDVERYKMSLNALDLAKKFESDKIFQMYENLYKKLTK
jgi:glycosyltransferase involved in cell wall biosynthesis